MADYGPWTLPFSYTDPFAEYKALRENAVIFDACFQAQIGFAGPGAEILLERIFSCNTAAIAQGRAEYGFLLNEKGEILCTCTLYALPEELIPPIFLLSVHTLNISGLLEWITRQAPDVQL